jgi:hypothetical protein
VATKVSDVPRVKKVQDEFNAWLFRQYAGLRAAGEAKDLSTAEEKLTYMRDLFDRSGGVIRRAT